MINGYKELVDVELRRMRKNDKISKKLLHVLLILGYFLLPAKYKAAALLYGWFREVDDVIDQEKCPPNGYDIDSYIEQKELILKGVSTVQLKEDIMLFSALRIFSKKKIDLSQEIKDLFCAMKTEYLNRGKFVKREDLYSNMYLQDRAALTILAKFYSNGKKFEKLDQILFRFFTRVDSLLDLKEDLTRGFINIPLEDAIEMGIDIQTPAVEILRNHKFQEWYKREVEELIIRHARVYKILEERRDLFLLKVILDSHKLGDVLNYLKVHPSFLFFKKTSIYINNGLIKNLI
ncbi:MAG: class 1 isoprenoid biosynthesis enzyme [Candidatus Pacebacteria bacterium]|nr:class 1 isoprenoid biosynthesis enzyme [Candidatus Paceibacterota bacterium]MDD2757147.1 class 1 isoprenoid biosynthesis enzyme [Candidatus Paceibacterota bacterium]MDD3283681.1 class 1 isoprenoid biosynthesis enzyme [Candidatus Paceibacterota bacterium]MDD4737709.1 class 1 isoprenoid biosynthesis enzyme [Candidatus Paceibacterota bacterium]